MNRFLSKDFLSGLMFIGFGLLALYFGQKLALGTPVRMGPGYVPHMLACAMLVLGLIIAAVALVYPGETIEEPKWKPVTTVTIGIVCFALLLETTGLFPALVVLILIVSWGSDEFGFREVCVNIMVLTALCFVVFKLGLGMNISMIEGLW